MSVFIFSLKSSPLSDVSNGKFACTKTTKAYVGVKVQLHSFLTSTADKDQQSAVYLLTYFLNKENVRQTKMSTSFNVI
jgi:hypothetical protein